MCFTGSKFQLVSNITDLHALTPAACSYVLLYANKSPCHRRNMNPNLLMLGHFRIVAGNYSDQKLGEQAENSQWLHSLSFVENRNNQLCPY